MFQENTDHLFQVTVSALIQSIDKFFKFNNLLVIKVTAQFVANFPFKLNCTIVYFTFHHSVCLFKQDFCFDFS